MVKGLSAFARDPKITFKDQEAGENVLLLLRRHQVTNIWWIFVTLVLAVFPLFFWLGNAPSQLAGMPFFSPGHLFLLTLVWYLFTLGFALINFLDWFFNVDLITDKRLVDMDYENLLYFRASETNYSKLEDVTYKVSGIFQSIFNFGNVEFQTAGTEENFDLEEVPNPEGVHDLITDLMAKTPEAG
ncbi:MAG: hypothetical protein M1352_01455 [Patescibacteria group bacterium]|nr:hypothetical protein [Patescibacteria group bacterium]